MKTRTGTGTRKKDSLSQDIKKIETEAGILNQSSADVLDMTRDMGEEDDIFDMQDEESDSLGTTPKKKPRNIGGDYSTKIPELGTTMIRKESTHSSISLAGAGAGNNTSSSQKKTAQEVYNCALEILKKIKILPLASNDLQALKEWLEKLAHPSPNDNKIAYDISLAQAILQMIKEASEGKLSEFAKNNFTNHAKKYQEFSTIAKILAVIFILTLSIAGAVVGALTGPLGMGAGAAVGLTSGVTLCAGMFWRLPKQLPKQLREAKEQIVAINSYGK